MANSLFLSRDVKVYLKLPGTNALSYEIPVLDGFSFSQATNSSEVTLSEMESNVGFSRRGKKQFNDSLAPAEWSFSTYVRPYKDNGVPGAVEEALWAMFTGKATSDSTTTGDILTWTLTDGSITTDLGGPTYFYNVAGEGNTAGTGATFDLVVTNTTVTATLKEAGSGYVGAETITILGSVIGGTDGIDNITITVDTVGVASDDNRTVEGVYRDEDVVRFDFTRSNTSSLGEGTLCFFFAGETAADNKYYEIDLVAVNEASIDFDIDGITMINWSGMGRVISSTSVAPTYIATAVTTGNSDTSNFIRNRLTTLDIAPDLTHPGQSGLQPSYAITLTGGNITMSNNITYVTPEELGRVNQPLAHVTGTRSVSGSFTAYIESGTNTTESFWADLQSLTNVVSNRFNVQFNVGGTTAIPRIEFKMPRCHVDIPTINIEDVIAIETSFNALPSSFNEADDAVITYYGPEVSV